MEKRTLNKSPEETARLQLHFELCDILGTKNVYFQPPSSVKMAYPAIVYQLEDIVNAFANNNVYGSRRKYIVTLIDPNPDSPFIKPLGEMSTCRFMRFYVSEGLNHYVFTMFH